MTLSHGQRRRSEAGFTLIEVVILIAAVGFVFAMLVLGIRQAIGSFALRRAASVTTVELRRAQAAAMAKGQGFAYTVEFIGGTPGGIRIYEQNTTTPVRVILPPDEWPATVTIDLSNAGTTLQNCSAPANTANKCVTFQPLGYASQSGTVAIKGGTGTTVTYLISVAAATGKVSVTQ